MLILLFQKGIYNVPEPISDHYISPEAFDLILVPLLICDRKGFRVGYGKVFMTGTCLIAELIASKWGFYTLNRWMK
jgi:5-formyltetrahydrofolate cyclo-ligase